MARRQAVLSIVSGSVPKTDQSLQSKAKDDEEADKVDEKAVLQQILAFDKHEYLKEAR